MIPRTITEHQGPEHIFDFKGYRKVKVQRVDPDMVDAEPNCCIDNSRALAEHGDIDIVQGYIQIREGVEHAIFHYWNYDPEVDRYYDCSPIGSAVYWIKE